MALQWADFPSGQLGIYGSGNAGAARSLNGIYAQAVFTLEGDPDPTVGDLGLVCRPNPQGQNAIGGPRFVLSDLRTVVGIGHRMWLPSLPAAVTPTVYVASWRTVSNSFIASVTVDTTGRFNVHAGDRNATVIASTPVPAITANAWNHIESRLTQGIAGAGEIEIRVNGVSVLSATGLTFNSPGTSIAQVSMGTQNNATSQSITAFFKDLIIWDNQGSTFNTFQGSVSVGDLYPNGDVNLQWTPSTGSTGFNLINETTPDDTTRIIADDAPPGPSTFSLTNLDPDVTSVRALIPISRSQKSDGGDANLQTAVSPDGVNFDSGADRPITTAFTYRWDVSEVSPATASPWTPIEVNNATVRVDRTL